jgi:two-component system, NtrC family, sensor kinase
MMAGTVAVAVLLFVFAAWQHYISVSRLADERIASSLDIASEHAQKVFQSIDVVFGSVAEMTRGRADQSLRLHEAELNERLRTMVSAISDVRAIWLFDLNGEAIATSSFFPVPRLNNSDRDYFRAQQDKTVGTYVGGILRPKIGSDIFFSVSQKRYDSSGEFSGITAVVVSPSVFENFYKRLARNSSASYAMIRSDGAVLARYPIPVEPGIVLPPTSGFRRTVASNPEGGGYSAVSGVDGLARRFQIQRLGSLPLYATSSLELASIWSDWFTWVALQLMFGLPVTVALLLLEYLALRRTNDFYAEVSRRESAETSLRQSQKMEAIGQLTGGIAHDFNNLLTIIIGNLQSLTRQFPKNQKLQLKLANALTGADRAAQLTHRLLAFSRRQPLDPKPLDSNDLISHVSDLLARSLGEHVEFEIVRAGGLWRTEVDPGELEAAIINLSVNARDAMPNGGKITIETANIFLDETYCGRFQDLNVGQYVMISVADSGQGMTPDVVERAFDPFFTTKDPGLGTGLGLSQVYGFAKQSGGHVQIHSEMGVGTTVKLYLPRTFSKQLEAPARVSPELMQGQGECILVVEDDDGVRNYLSEALVELNYLVRTALSGEAALKVIDEPGAKIDLVLTDVVMPGMNGRELCEKLLGKRPDLKVLYMTGYSRDAIVHGGRLDAGVSLIQKPISERDLALRIRLLLDADEQRVDELQATK